MGCSVMFPESVVQFIFNLSNSAIVLVIYKEYSTRGCLSFRAFWYNVSIDIEPVGSGACVGKNGKKNTINVFVLGNMTRWVASNRSVH